MVYIDILKKNIFFVKFLYYNLLIKKMNFVFLHKLGFLKNKSKKIEIKKNISLLKTIINKKINENFKRRGY